MLANMLITDGGFFPGMERMYINQEYVRALSLAGAVPLLLPVIEDEEDAIREQIERVDGVLLSGGHDVNPLTYGEEPQRQLGFIFPEVDEHQVAAARIAASLQKPMFGICRGMQIMNVAFGGTLYQDLSQVSEQHLKHFQQSKMYVPGHTVEISEGSRLHQVFGQETILTNSFHHQAVKDIAPGFVVNARAKDGVIEGMERSDGVFTLAVQWHPEMMVDKNADMLNLIRAFVRAVATKQRGQ
ncbi:gamma-glutamyl-gamma-aminobutyrate hydrolase family protein [Sporomusa malonica]|uniref:gamma-glutamyl-gamma-aminobutyrate hydrolase family protein n=1 Tax=Sporomusa malonica TaxID=112901 RepID=UPI00352A02F0